MQDHNNRYAIDLLSQELVFSFHVQMADWQPLSESSTYVRDGVLERPDSATRVPVPVVRLIKNIIALPYMNE